MIDIKTRKSTAMSDRILVRAWYVSPGRLLELIGSDRLPPDIRRALLFQDAFDYRALLANEIGPTLISYLKEQAIRSLPQHALEGSLRPGVPFTYQGHFYGKGFGDSNKGNQVSLTADVSRFYPNKRLLIEFSKQGITTNTAFSRLGGSTNLFAFCSVTEIDSKRIRAVPYVVGDLVESCGGFDVNFESQRRLSLKDIREFHQVKFEWRPSKKQFEMLRSVPEQVVKRLLCEILGELDVPKDWGGEECDLFTSNVTVNEEQVVAAFLLKGPSRFHEMQFTDCGKNGDQIHRLFHVPADLFVVQHCHRISPAVRQTVANYVLARYSARCRYLFIDGYDTARILHSYNKLPKPERGLAK